MSILVAIVSIYAFTGLAYLIRKNFRVNICPICAGVSFTWMWMLLGIGLGVVSRSFIFPVGIMMGMSVLGIVKKINEKQYKFWQSPKIQNNQKVEELKEKMKNCC